MHDANSHDWRADVRKRLASANLDPQAESELVEEVAQHLEDQFAELSRAVGPVSARDQLLAQLRDQQFDETTKHLKQRVKPIRARTWTSTSLLRDIRYGFRSLLRTPGTLITGTTALALGIGLTTMMFSIIYGMLIKGLPFENAERIAAIFYMDRDRPEDGTMPLADFYQYQLKQQSFERLGAYQNTRAVASFDNGAEQMPTGSMTAGVIDLTGVRAMIGRTFTASDNELAAPPTAVIAYSVWRDRYASDSTIVGKTIRVNGVEHTIIGVMPDKFAFPNGNKLWLALQARAIQHGRDNSGPHVLVTGRLKKGVEYKNALMEFGTLTEVWRKELRDKVEWLPEVKPFIRSSLAPRVFALLYAMLGAVLLVLLVACANVTNLLLNRATKRTREVAIRTALGASRLAVIRQALVESSIIALLASGLGAAIAQLGTMAFNRALIDQQLPFWTDIRLHPPVLFFVLVVAAVASCVSGVLPALQSARLDVNAFLKDESHAASSLRSARMSRVIVVTEIALSSAMLLAAGFMTKSVINMRNLDPAFTTEGLVTAQISSSTRDTVTQRRFIEAVERELATATGIKNVSLSSGLPGIGWSNVPYKIEGRPASPESNRSAVRTLAVNAGFSATFGVPVVKGRFFAATDRLGSTPVAIVNEAFVRRNFPDQEPIGQRIRIGESDAEGEWLTVIGVMPNIYANSFQNPFPPEVLTAFWQLHSLTGAAVAVSGIDNASTVATIRRVVATIDRDAPVSLVSTMSDIVAKERWAPQVLGSMFVIFGLCSLVLAAIGLYAVMAFSVTRRVREMGVRMALGANSLDVIRLVCRQGLMQTVVGMTLGLLAGAGLVSGVRAVLFQVQPSDPSVFVLVVVVLGASALIACLIPAVRATRVDPVVALRVD